MKAKHIKPTIVALTLAAAALSYSYRLYPGPLSEETTSEKATEAPQAETASPAPEPSRVPAVAHDPIPTVEGFYAEYFNRTLLGNPLVARIYGELKSRLPAGLASELAAIYVAEGPARSGSPDFTRFMSSLQAEIESHSLKLFELLNSQDAVFRRDPFFYQMALNLAFNLDLPTEAKAKLLGNAMNIHFARDERTGVTMMSANLTNALILMKNSGVTLEQALPYIRKGLAVNADDPDALREYLARVNAYYPGAI